MAGGQEFVADKHIGKKNIFVFFSVKDIISKPWDFEAAAGGQDLNFTPRARRRSIPVIHWQGFHPLLPRQRHLQMDKTGLITPSLLPSVL